MKNLRKNKVKWIKYQQFSDTLKLNQKNSIQGIYFIIKAMIKGATINKDQKLVDKPNFENVKTHMINFYSNAENMQ